MSMGISERADTTELNTMPAPMEQAMLGQPSDVIAETDEIYLELTHDAEVTGIKVKQIKV